MSNDQGNKTQPASRCVWRMFVSTTGSTVQCLHTIVWDGILQEWLRRVSKRQWVKRFMRWVHAIVHIAFDLLLLW